MLESSQLSAPLTENDVELLFQAILKRPVNDEVFKKDAAARGSSLLDFVIELRESDEHALRMRAEWEALSVRKQRQFRDPLYYRVPQDLLVTSHPVRRVLVIGSCLSEH